MPPLDASHGWTEKCTVSTKINICKNPPTINIDNRLCLVQSAGKKLRFSFEFLLFALVGKIVLLLDLVTTRCSVPSHCFLVCVCVFFYMAFSGNMHLTCIMRTLWLVRTMKGLFEAPWVLWWLGWAECSHRDRTTNIGKCVWEQHVLVGVVTV